MSVIKKISVYQNNAWTEDDIGAYATNVSLSPPVGGKNNVGDALHLLPQTLTEDRFLTTVRSGTDTVIRPSTLSTQEIENLPNDMSSLSNQVSGLSEKADNLEGDISVVSDTVAELTPTVTILKGLFQENCAVTHNNVYRGKLLAKSSFVTDAEETIYPHTGGNSSIDALYNDVQAGEFKNIYIGDKIRIAWGTDNNGNIIPLDLIVMGIDWYLHRTGNRHHLLLVPEKALGTEIMCDSSYQFVDGSTIPVYYNSTLRKNLEFNYLKGSASQQNQRLRPQLNQHLICFARYIESGGNIDLINWARPYANTSAQGSWRGCVTSMATTEWGAEPGTASAFTPSRAMQLELLSIIEVQGTPTYISSLTTLGDKTQQLPGFKLNPSLKIKTYNTQAINWWLDSYMGSNNPPSGNINYWMSTIDSSGAGYRNGMGTSQGIVPLLCFGESNITQATT